MTTIATAENELTTATDAENEARSTLNALRAAAGKGQNVTPTELSDAGSALEIAQLQRENAATQLQQLVEDTAEDMARSLAELVEEFAARAPDTQKLLRDYQRATEAYVSAIAKHNAELRGLIRKAEQDDPSGTHTQMYRAELSRTRGKITYGPTLGLHTDSASCRFLPTPEGDMSNTLHSALKQLKGE